MTQYILASANPDKAQEIREILHSELLHGDIELLPRPTHVPDVVEDGETLEDNARLKAKALVEATGLPSIADDTGLEVDALDGGPGVHAARYAGENATYEDNQRKLLAALDGLPDEKRGARFRTIALLRNPDGSEVIAEGVVGGIIAAEAKGDGWGYDPIFIPNEGAGRRFAEMSSEEKHKLSHRGRAFRKLADLIGSN